MVPYFSNSKKATVVENRFSSIIMLEAAPSRVRFPAIVLAIANVSQALASAPISVR